MNVPAALSKNTAKLVNFGVIIVVWFLLSKSGFFASGIGILFKYKLVPFASAKSNSGRLSTLLLPSSQLHSFLVSNVNRSMASQKKSITILITLESFGNSPIPSLSNFTKTHLEAALLKVVNESHSYSLSALQDEYPFLGTLGAELRYLCDIQSESQLLLYQNLHASLADSSNCIPSIVRHYHGYTHYFHSGHGYFYNRYKVMPFIGFKEASFLKSSFNPLDNLRACITLPFCGNDRPLYAELQSAIKRISRSSRYDLGFFSFMTIDTHAPYLGRMDIVEAYKSRVLLSIADIASFVSSVLEDNPDVDFTFILASDHPPPINQNTRAMLEMPTNALIKSNIVFLISRKTQ